MFEAANIREWRGHDVVDAQDHKIGELEAVYVDTSTDLPSFGTVKVGMPTRHRLVFVPLDRATVGPGYLKVAYDKKQVKDAPSIDTDGELPAAEEEAVFKHYGLTLPAGRLRRAAAGPPLSDVINAPTRAWSGRAGHPAPGAPRRPTSPRERAGRRVIRPSRSRGTGCR